VSFRVGVAWLAGGFTVRDATDTPGGADPGMGVARAWRVVGWVIG
jgi:hypothetical protein